MSFPGRRAGNGIPGNTNMERTRRHHSALWTVNIRNSLSEVSTGMDDCEADTNQIVKDLVFCVNRSWTSSNRKWLVIENEVLEGTSPLFYWICKIQCKSTSMASHLENAKDNRSPRPSATGYFKWFGISGWYCLVVCIFVVNLESHTGKQCLACCSLDTLAGFRPFLHAPP